MKKLIILIPFLILSCAKEIKVISYNIRYKNPNDGMNIWENRRETVGQLILNETPNFIGMQEVKHQQLTDLQKILNGYDYIGVGRDDGKTKGEYSPIFFDRNKHQVLKSNTFWLSERPDTISIGWDASMERICTYGLFKNKENDQTFWVFNTHFDHRGHLAREKSTQLIIKTINNLNTEKLPVILTGDFNLTPETSSIKLLQKNFRDVQEALPITDPFYGTTNGFGNSKYAGHRIDYVFTKKINVKSAKHLYQKTPLDGWASDHHAVIASLELIE
jgi:endonuclease/exonuclease/phosphatase family metal-dependent hydrolase